MSRRENVYTNAGRKIPVKHLQVLAQRADELNKSRLSFIADHCRLGLDDARHVLREAGLR